MFPSETTHWTQSQMDFRLSWQRTHSSNRIVFAFNAVGSHRIITAMRAAGTSDLRDITLTQPSVTVLNRITTKQFDFETHCSELRQRIYAEMYQVL
jgi:hypothetical protein